MRVAAKAGEKLGGEAVVVQMSGRDGVKEVKAGYGPPGSVGLAILMRQHQCRSASPVDDPRGKDAQHSPMPVRMIENKAFGGIASLVIEQCEQVVLDGG